MTTGKSNVRWAQQFDGDLAGYRVYRSLSPSGPWTLAGDPGLTGSPTSPAYTVSDFSSNALWYFVVTAYDTTGNESGVSAAASKIITRPLTRIQRTAR